MSKPKHVERRLVTRPEAPTFRINDRVVANGRLGTIVGDITADEYVPTLRSATWRTLAAGVLVRWDDGTITHIREPRPSLRLVVQQPSDSTRNSQKPERKP